MLRVGLTGGIASGKSTTARLLRGHGAVVVDADAVAREVVAPGTPGLAAVVAAFGEEVLAPDGALDRARLGRVVFADEERRRALNAVVHPRVAARTAELVAAAEAEDPDGVLVHDVPLLVENGLARRYDVVVVVDVPPRLQLDRLVRTRGLSPQEARDRVAAQAGRDERLAVADVVLDGSGDERALAAQVERLWADLRDRRGSAGPPS